MGGTYIEVDGKKCNSIKLIQHFTTKEHRSTQTDIESGTGQKEEVISINLADNKMIQLPLRDIIAIDQHEGCSSKIGGKKLCRCRKTTESSSFFVIFYIDRTSKKPQWIPRSMVIRFKKPQTMSKYFNEFKQAFNDFCRVLKRPKKLFVILNPICGAGKATSIWHAIAYPLFQLAGIEINLVRTQFRKHAYDLCMELDFSSYDGLVTIGGDGTLNECVHALAARRERGEFERCPIPVGLIPAGSYNCINQVTSGVVCVGTTCLQIIVGQTIGIDVIFLKDRNEQLVKVSFCSVAYGFFGDLLIRSERLRRMGPMRYVFAGILSIMRLRSYWIDTCISIADVPHRDLTDASTECKQGCTICQNADRIEEIKSKESRSKMADVTYIQVVANRCSNKQSKRGVSPNAHLGDGTIDVVVIHKADFPRWNALKLLLAHRINAGSYKFDFLEAFRAKCCNIVIPFANSEQADAHRKEILAKNSILHSNESLVNSRSPLVADQHSNYGDSSSSFKTTRNYQKYYQSNPEINNEVNQKINNDDNEVLKNRESNDVTRNQNQEGLDMKNMHALWNIDGETCESDFLRLQPVCQFVRFYATRPQTDA